jgi:hypothetical protein
MTKARDISGLIGAGGIIDNSKITLDANEIPSLDTAKITTGTFADARISQSSVSQHATSFDDSKIQQDLMVLALQQATDANKSAYSLSNSFIEQFEDSLGIDVQTNTIRNASEYVSSVVAGSTTEFDYNSASPKAKVLFNGMINSNNVYYEIDNDGDAAFGGSQNVIPAIAQSNNGYVTYMASNTSAYFIYDYQQNYTFLEKIKVGKFQTWGDISQYTISYSTDGSNFTAWNTASATQLGATINTGAISGGGFVSGNSSGHINMGNPSPNGTTTGNTIFTLQGMPTITARYIKLITSAFNAGKGNDNAGGGIFAPFTVPLIVNATGNFTSVSQTAPATVSKMGIVVLYKNNYGTATLNTDLIAQVSANNGTDFTTVTLTPRGTFSTGINIAVANNVTVTSGTSCKYKISFANQSAGVKETQVHGIGLLY